MLIRRNIHIEDTQTEKLNNAFVISGSKSAFKPAALIRRAINEFIDNHPELFKKKSVKK